MLNKFFIFFSIIFESFIEIDYIDILENVLEKDNDYKGKECNINKVFLWNRSFLK